MIYGYLILVIEKIQFFYEEHGSYRLRQYYKSKILHNAEVVTWFSTFYRFPKTVKESRSPIDNASFGSLKAKVGQLNSP